MPIGAMSTLHGQFAWVQKQSTLCFKKVHPYDTGWPLTWRTWKLGNLRAVRQSGFLHMVNYSWHKMCKKGIIY